MRVKGMWGVAIHLLVALMLFGWSVAAEAATVSGTVTNNTGKTGSRVYLSIMGSYGGNPTYGVSIPTPGPNTSAPFTIRGVPDGSYVVNAFLDARSSTSATRHSNDPFGSSQQFAVNGGDVSNVSVTMNMPSPLPALQAPAHGGVLPGPGSALINWNTPQDNNGHELAYSYNVYWHTDNTVSPTNYTGKKTGIPARGDGMYIQTTLNGTTPLPDGTTLYYVVEAQRGQSGQQNVETAASAVYGPVTIGARPTDHTSTFTVSGTITIDNSITITGPLLVAVYSDTNGVFLAKISNPGVSNNFTVTGVPNGSYQVFSLIDQNNDGLVWTGDYTVGDRMAPNITVSGADLPGITANIPKKDVDALVATSHSLDANGQESYGLNFNVSQAFRLPVNVAVRSGQDVAGPVDLAVSDWGNLSYWVSNVARPTPGTQYTLDIGYDDSSLASVPVTVTGVLDSFPEPINPTGSVTYNPAPVFSWAPPVTPPAGVYTYNLRLNGNNIWWNPDRLPSTQTSAPYNFDNNASQNTLADNTAYAWEIAVNDQNGNQASKGASFFSGGSVSGTVKGSDTNAGVAGISVQIYDGNGTNMPWQYNTMTLANGNFTIGGLPSGNYRLCFYPGQTGYIAQCYDNKAFDPLQGTDVSVTSPGDTPLNAITLIKSATISGTVTASAGGPIQGVLVELRDVGGNWVPGVNQGQTDASGNYTLSGFQSGVSYKLYFNGTAQGYIPQWYNGKSDSTTADTINLGAGQTQTANAVLALGGSITGTVRDAVTSAPIAGINVQLYDQSGMWIPNTSTSTGGNGSYTIGGLQNGTYKVCFNSGSTNYIGKCYDNVNSDPFNATSIPVTAPNTVSAIDATLAVGGTISGQVTNGTGGIQWVNVQLRDTSGNWLPNVPSASTDQSGNYTLGGIPAGSYKVYFDVTNTGYIGKWYNNGPGAADQTGATPLTINAGSNTPNIGAVLSLGGSISGQVTDIDTTFPVFGINVQIFDNAGQWLPNSPMVTTDNSGHFTIGGLQDGTYKICFNSGSTSYLGKCYDQLALDPANATSIQISGANNLTGKNAALKLGATINGRVTSGSGPIPNIAVQLLNLDGSWVQSVNTSMTDGSGNYSIRAIPAGNYKVYFDTFNTNYVPQWYAGASTLNAATQVTLVNGDVRNGVNALLSLDTTPPTSSASPAGGGYSGPVSVTLFASEPATIYYTTSGSDPNLSSPSLSVSIPGGGSAGPLSISPPATLKFFAVDRAGNAEATIHAESYTLGIPTTTTLLANLNPSTYGAGVTLTANVSSAQATGSVQFYADGVPIGIPVPLSGGSASTTVSSLAAGTRTITAVYTGGGGYAGSSSNQLSQTVNPATLTVTANSQTKVYGLNDPTLSYTYNGIVNGDPPSIFSGSLTRGAGESVGTYAISQGSLSAGSNYTINFTGANLTITKATLTINANAMNKVYGAADPLLTYSNSGLANGDTSAVITGTLTRLPGENAGTYAIQQGALSVSNNYTISFTGANLTITKAPLTVTATSVSKVYNASLPALTYTINGFVNGETQAVVSGAPAESTTATGASPVGTYPINIGQGTLAAANYTFGPFTDGTLTVTKAPATLTLNNLTQTADGSPKPVTVTTNPAGLTVVSVTYTGISGTIYGPSTTAPSAVGSYSVVASLNNANYQATDATGTLGINAKPTPVITWANPANITYGTALSGTQLNATATDPVSSATVAGTFVYTPANGVLNAGSQTLSVTFTPTDTTTYNTATKSVTINVQKATLSITADPQTKVYGSADPALTYSNSGLVNGDTVAVITGALTRNGGENVGSKTIQQGSLSAGNNYTINFTGSNLTITAKPLTITADVKTKVYGAADPILTYTQSGLVAGDSFSGALTRVAGESVGTYAISQGSLSAGGNYTISFTGANLTITKAALTITANAQTKVYGAADPTFSYTQSGLIGGDSISGLLGRVAGENVGSYAIQQGTLSAGNNYTISFAGANLTVTPKALTATGITAANKAYDGTATASLNFSGASLTGVVGGDTVSLNTVSAAGTFADKNVGNGKTVTLSGLSLNNNGAGNYTLQTPVTATANITAAPLTIAANAQTKVYGAVDPAPLTYQITGGTLFAGDSIGGSMSRAAGENVGSYAILQGTISAGGNYTISFTGANLTITAKPLTITAVAQSKVYGAADPALTYTQSGLVAGDSITGALTRVAGENAGTYAIQQGNLSAGNNYSISFSGANLTINKAPLTITANAQAKVYGAADPTLSYTQSGLVGVDSITGALTRVAGENVGSYAIQQGNLSAGNNYTISFTGANLTVTAKALTATGITAANKTYDGTATASLNFGGASLTGVVGGDTVSLNTGSATGAFSDKNVGNGKTVTLSGLSLNNNSAGNYTLQAPVTTTANITAAPLTVAANTQTKVYGATDPALTYQVTSGTLLTGDSIGGSMSRAAGENVGSYAIQQGTLSAGGNYTISFTGANLTVTAKSLTVTADPKSKVFGSVDPALTYTQSGLVAGDNIGGALNRVAGENAGTYAINQGTLSVGSNYVISFTGANLTITKATPVITWTNPANIQAGTALGGTQLNATASATGSFAYTPAAGTVLSAGNGQTLQVSFTPADSANYNNATKSVTINVAPVLAGSGMLPADQATDVSLYAKAKLVFNNDMDASSLNTSTFTLSSSAGAVSGTVSYNAASRTATFTPDAALDSSTVYTATVTTGAMDTFGFPLVSSKVWSFTTDGYGNIDTTSNSGTGHRVDIADALKYLHIAAGFEGPPANMPNLVLAPIINGVPTPDPNRHNVNVQDVIAILERVVGLW